VVLKRGRQKPRGQASGGVTTYLKKKRKGRGIGWGSEKVRFLSRLYVGVEVGDGGEARSGGKGRTDNPPVGVIAIACRGGENAVGGRAV